VKGLNIDELEQVKRELESDLDRVKLKLKTARAAAAKIAKDALLKRNRSAKPRRDAAIKDLQRERRRLRTLAYCLLIRDGVPLGRAAYMLGVSVTTMRHIFIREARALIKMEPAVLEISTPTGWVELQNDELRNVILSSLCPEAILLGAEMEDGRTVRYRFW
jgi:hypothetical protein